MIYSLTGKIEKIDDNTVVVDTGAISFEVCCSTYTAYVLAGKTEPQTILTYLQVKEDGMSLFGFIDKKEKLLFNNLITISGVGPKLAISVLSGLPFEDILNAILKGDVKLLSSIKGLGKKTAERIILELSGKMGVENSIDSLLSSSNASAKPVLKKEIDEAYEVLVSSGIAKAEALELAKNNYTEGMTSEQLVLMCFKNLHK